MRSVRTVVLDPGHGGRDPGAIGVGGLREKQVTLAMARALREDLEERGFEVVLTREGDETLTLEDRTARAEAARGDLFVSLHANAARRRSVRGVETYYLDENHERHSVTVAARENGVDRHEVNALQRTLAKLRVHEVSPQSRRLAELIQERIVKGMPRPYGPVPDLGVKKGPFYVLFLSTMPAVLVEAGFLTNQTEAKRLRDRGYIDAMAGQIAEALTVYRETNSSNLAWRGDR
jgi:N-acetylmuramoyl-L-alanine amidase